MTEEAKSSTVGADYIPFEKRTRGKVYKRPEKASSRAPRTTTTTTTDMDEIDRLLAGMSADDIGDLAGEVFFFGVLTGRAGSYGNVRGGGATSIGYTEWKFMLSRFSREIVVFSFLGCV